MDLSQKRDAVIPLLNHVRSGMDAPHCFSQEELQRLRTGEAQAWNEILSLSNCVLREAVMENILSLFPHLQPNGLTRVTAVAVTT